MRPYPAIASASGSSPWFQRSPLAPHAYAGEESHHTATVPANIQVPRGTRAFLVGHAVDRRTTSGLPQATGFQIALFNRRSRTLFNNADKEVLTTTCSPNPVEGARIRALAALPRDAK